MNDVKKGWVLGGILLILIIGIFLGIFWKNNSKSLNNYFENVVDKVKEIIGVKDASEQLNDNVKSNYKPNETTKNSSKDIPTDGGSGGGGGGGGGSGASEASSENSSDIILGSETFFSLQELFNFNNPVGNRVEVYGIAFQVSGVDMYDNFFFTDDEEIINNPVLLLINGADFHITVYNSLININPQSKINVKGIVVDCEHESDGIYCIKATLIEIQ